MSLRVAILFLCVLFLIWSFYRYKWDNCVGWELSQIFFFCQIWPIHSIHHLAIDEQDLTFISIGTQTLRSFYGLTMNVRDVPKGEYKKMQPFIRSRKFSPKVSLMEHNLHFCSTRLVTRQQRPLRDQDPLWQIPLNAGTVRQREHCFSDPQPIWLSARYTTVHASSDWQRPKRIFSLVVKPSSQDIEQN